MLKIFTLSLLALLCLFSSAQEPVLYLLTKKSPFDFAPGIATISKFDVASGTVSSVHNFAEDNLTPIGELTQGTNGKFYGLKTGNNSSGQGILFSFDPISLAYTKLFDFTSPNGAQPTGRLEIAGNKLYGTTSKGGSNGSGVIYSYDYVNATYTKLYDFKALDGAGEGDLKIAYDGKLYGTRSEGGSNNYGTVFCFDLKAGSFKKLYEFQGATGARPVGAPILEGNGKLYGVTARGGNGFIYDDGFKGGVLYTLELPSLVYDTVHNFGLSLWLDNLVFNGAYPNGALMKARDGKLYGVTAEGGVPSDRYHAGTTFSFSPANEEIQFELFYDLPSTPQPAGRLFQASNNKIYGTRAIYMPARLGQIYSIDDLNSLSVVTDGTNGGVPTGGLTEYVTCATPPKVSIPDAMVLSKGVEKNTVYTGYAPASTITLNAQAVGGSGDFNYEWSNGSTASSISVSPAMATSFTVTVKDDRGCVSVASKDIKVVNVSCGNKGDKVLVCNSSGNSKNTKDNCINPNAVEEQLQKGAYLGACPVSVPLAIIAAPNPSSSYFTITINSEKTDKLTVRVMDISGRLVEANMLPMSTSIKLGQNLRPGVYFVEVEQSGKKASLKLMKQ